MIPAGYMSKNVAARPEWLKADGVEDVCAVSGCVSPAFADYIPFWKHNGYWFFNAGSDIEQLCRQQGIDAAGATLFYYEVFEKEFDVRCAHRRMRLPDVASEIALLADKAIQGAGLYNSKIHVLSEMNKTIACTVARAQAELDYRPPVDLCEGMRRSLQWCFGNGQLP